MIEHVFDTINFGRYRCHADLVGIVVGGGGQPLWQGRNVRTSSRPNSVVPT